MQHPVNAKLDFGNLVMPAVQQTSQQSCPPSVPLDKVLAPPALLARVCALKPLLTPDLFLPLPPSGSGAQGHAGAIDSVPGSGALAFLAHVDLDDPVGLGGLVGALVAPPGHPLARGLVVLHLLARRGRLGLDALLGREARPGRLDLARREGLGGSVGKRAGRQRAGRTFSRGSCASTAGSERRTPAGVEVMGQVPRS
jgi:hypothetical protein